MEVKIKYLLEIQFNLYFFEISIQVGEEQEQDIIINLMILNQKILKLKKILYNVK